LIIYRSRYPNLSHYTPAYESYFFPEHFIFFLKESYMNSMKHSIERGQALILISLAAIGLFGIVGLAIDGSAKFSDRRHAQNAADTAALAGALEKATELTDGVSNLSPSTHNVETCPPPSGVSASPVCDALQLAGKDRAESNGYDNNLVSNTVEVYSPPISGYYSGDESYVQVIITSHVNTYFARVIGINQTQNTVQAVALTKEGGKLYDGSSVVSMNPSPNCGNGSVNVGGNGTINLNGGGIFVNSSASCGYSQTSCSVTLNISGGGGISSAGSPINQSCGTPAPADTTEPQVVVPDDVLMPAEPIECSQAHPLPTNPSGNHWIIYPGYYTDFPQAGLIANNKDIELAPGVYCVDSDIHWSGSTFTSLDGSNGITIYMKSGHTFNTSINSPITLNASTSGEYKGYLIILDGNMNSIQNCTINGGSYLDMNGTIFAPYCNITINGDNSTSSDFNAQVIGWDVKLNGNNTINFTYDPNNIPTIKRRVGLMR
jgi:putative Flp pilus-assembly TadE/G-like protein